MRVGFSGSEKSDGTYLTSPCTNAYYWNPEKFVVNSFAMR
ncbi:hypothetical protein KOR42_09620 [Thalassoglobus neptunius]|uniref:Uncharacterized protein n=1 Tax=Thalassoglobus neptunius TaxID=1938619 RepID=A0A5C5X408_9PLAN|nr:hypothetical protein KOR42_09620 [Thalassoglobus neptunius]